MEREQVAAVDLDATAVAGAGADEGPFRQAAGAADDMPCARPLCVGEVGPGLDEARTRGWTIVDMVKDWKQIFPARK